MTGKGIVTNKVQLSSIIVHQPCCLVRSCILESTSTWKSKNLWTSCHNNSTLNYLHSWVIFSSSKGIPETHIFAIRLRLTIQGFFHLIFLVSTTLCCCRAISLGGPRPVREMWLTQQYKTSTRWALGYRASRFLAVCLPVCLSACLSVCLPVCVCLPACHSLGYLSVCLYVCLSAWLSTVWLADCLFCCLSIVCVCLSSACFLAVLSVRCNTEGWYKIWRREHMISFLTVA